VSILNDFLDALQKSEKTPLQKFAAELLAAQKKSIGEGIYFAWDPLAAVALANPNAVSTTAMSISVTEYGPQTGRTVANPIRPPNAQVATTADAALFRHDFLAALATPPPAAAATQPNPPTVTPTPAPVPPPAAGANGPTPAPPSATPAATPAQTATPPAPAPAQPPKH